MTDRRILGRRGPADERDDMGIATRLGSFASVVARRGHRIETLFAAVHESVMALGCRKGMSAFTESLGG
jgi:hypothetical protein